MPRRVEDSVKRNEWRKTPDTCLGEVVEQRLENRVNHVGQGKSALKAVRDFIENLEIESEQIEQDKWIARTKDYLRL